MEVLTDGSLQGLLIIMCLVLALFGAYLLMVYLSNQSLKRLASRHGGPGRNEPEPPRTSRFFGRARWLILTLIVVVGGLCGLLILMTRLSP